MVWTIQHAAFRQQGSRFRNGHYPVAHTDTSCHRSCYWTWRYRNLVGFPSSSCDPVVFGVRQLTELVVTLIVAALASARIAVLIVHDTILDVPRDWFFRHFPPHDNMQLGFDYQARDKHGTRMPVSLRRRAWWFSELMTCTRCFTVWTTPPIYFLAVHSHAAFVGVGIIAAMSVASYVAGEL